MNIGECKYCGTVGELCNSHSIPNAFGKEIRRQNHGHTLVATKGSKRLARSYDGGGSPILCKDCEAYFNSKFDTYLIRHTRLIRSKFEDSENTTTEIEPNRLIKSLLSVFWRCCHSDEPAFNHLPAPKDSRRFLKLLASDKILVRDIALSVIVVSGISKNDTDEKIRKSMRSIILPPFLSPDISLSADGRGIRYSVLTMLMEGVCYLLILPRPGYPKNRAKAFVSPDAKQYRPQISAILDIPFVSDSILEIMEASIRESWNHSASSS